MFAQQDFSFLNNSDLFMFAQQDFSFIVTYIHVTINSTRKQSSYHPHIPVVAVLG